MAIFLLSATATAILLILLIYSLAVYLVRFIQVIHFIKWVIVVLLAIVVLFCFSCTAVWASFLERSSILFFMCRFRICRLSGAFDVADSFGNKS